MFEAGALVLTDGGRDAGYVHNENIALYKRLIAESESDLSRDEARHKMLLTLLAEETAKDNKPRSPANNKQSPSDRQPVCENARERARQGNHL